MNSLRPAVGMRRRELVQWILIFHSVWLVALSGAEVDAESPPHDEGLRISWQNDRLTIHGSELPGGTLEIWYLEAYCRANSRTTDWSNHTVVGHQTHLVSADEQQKQIQLRCDVQDGLVVEHTITAGRDEVNFHIVAKNPTNRRSEVHWAQPCIRVGRFTGCGPDVTEDDDAYLSRSFVFLDGQLVRMPTPRWATQARYEPGQVWAGPGVPTDDVNPRPLHPDRPSLGLIGCFRHDDQRILAVAFDPYQELFQGVIRCLHSDFRLGGIPAGEQRVIRGKLYLVPNDVEALVARYQRDFPSAASSSERNADSR